MASADLRPEFQYYLANQDEFVEKYDGKFLVIKNLTVLGAYDSVHEAIAESSKSHELGTFLVQQVTPGKSAYEQTFHSRVRFA